MLKLFLATTLLLPLGISVSAQMTRTLFQYGVADGFVAGMYKGEYPVRDLKTKGDFGLGAPDLIDGELTMDKGKIYQSKSTGETIEAPDHLTASLAFVCFFRPDTSFVIKGQQSQAGILSIVQKKLANKNGMYAIRISGLFDHLKTRAFPPVSGDSFPPLASILDRQHFFEYDQVRGTLVGYKMPAWLGGINIEGFHFHFLSEDHRKGGHALDFSTAEVTVEIGELTDIRVVPPTDRSFKSFDFKRGNTPELNKVEKGRSN